MISSTSIRALRKHMGLTQFEFAQALATTRVTVWRWENGGKQSPQSQQLIRLLARRRKFDQLADLQQPSER